MSKPSSSAQFLHATHIRQKSETKQKPLLIRNFTLKNAS